MSSGKQYAPPVWQDRSGQKYDIHDVNLPENHGLSLEKDPEFPFTGVHTPDPIPAQYVKRRK